MHCCWSYLFSILTILYILKIRKHKRRGGQTLPHGITLVRIQPEFDLQNPRKSWRVPISKVVRGVRAYRLTFSIPLPPSPLLLSPLPENSLVGENNFKPLISLPPAVDYRDVPPDLIFVLLAVKPGASCNLSAQPSWTSFYSLLKTSSVARNPLTQPTPPEPTCSSSPTLLLPRSRLPKVLSSSSSLLLLLS